MGNQIVVDERAGLRNLVQNVTDFAEFSGMVMGDKWIDNRQLLLYLVSQRDVTSMFRCFRSKNILSHGRIIIPLFLYNLPDFKR